MMPAFIRGVINLRGAVVPVIDLAARFGGTPTQVGSFPITVKVTERNMAWPMMGLASYYAVDHDAGVLSALQKLFGGIADLAQPFLVAGACSVEVSDVVCL